jgi:hypothetical protein
MRTHRHMWQHLLCTRMALHVSQKYIIRHRGDSNPCGQSPMDFESISLTARTQCLVVKARNIRLCTARRCWMRDSSAPMSAYVPSAPRIHPLRCCDGAMHMDIYTNAQTNNSPAWHEHLAIERQLRLSSPKRCLATGTNRNIKRAHGVVVSHPLRMRKALGSIPSGSICQDVILMPCVFALVPTTWLRWWVWRQVETAPRSRVIFRNASFANGALSHTPVGFATLPNTKGKRLKGPTDYSRKQTLPWSWCSHREGLNIQGKSLRSRTLSLKPQLSSRRTSFNT